MTHLKKLFETPMKAVISSVCAVGILAGVGTGTAYAASAIAENTSIGAENAQNFAFADAGVDPAEATLTRTEFDFEQGQFVYEVEFTAGGTEYEYWIKSSDGTVVKKEVELVSLEASTATAEAAQITLDEARAAALTDAGLTEAEVTFTQGKLDEEDGAAVYDIEFYTDAYEYEYEINAATGAVYSKSKETRTVAEAAADTTAEVTETADQLTLDEAKAVALADAEAAEADVTYTKAKLDTDDGVAVYDIEFYTATQEYEYEINAATGAIVDKSVENIQTATGNTDTGSTSNSGATDSTGNTASASYIGVDKAKTIALSDAGVTASDATFTAAKQDKDDGVVVYDIEFYTSAKEYEYEINATTGAILDKDVETRKTSTGSTGTGSTSNSGATDSTGTTASTSYIGVDKAKTIALSDAGVTASDATFTTAKQDKDDGVVVYDIEFYTSTNEYEYEINATTGAILDKDV
ncbi:MAG: PepSY domain-containing protein, partial [Clostridiales bacterium]|nr:PepSY domain-containing protein [Clostridiales bacterium]